MKFTLNWLKDHLDTTASLTEISEALTSLGLEVDAVEDRAAVYAPFAVAYVEKAERHPDADRLQVLTVDTGKAKLQVVCGAPNARAGMKGVFAPEGSLIPGTGITLKKGNIRGVESCGMMVSEREMGLSDEQDGIIDLPADTPVGTPLAEIYRLNDPVIEIGLTPNRGDCAGVRGIARDLAAAGLGTLKPLPDSKAASAFKNPVAVMLDFPASQSKNCPLFIGRLIRGVKNGTSPDYIRDRLIATGHKPISTLVDITNYMTLGMNRPLHVFDADKIKGNLVVRAARKGESFVALNGKTYDLDDGMTVVCDDTGVLALAGVIGGESTGVSETTTNVYVEAAYFDPLRTARTGRALQIDSDARYRFERGIDPAFTAQGMDIATAMIIGLCGGEASDVITAGAAPDTARTIEFDPAYVAKLGGVDIAPARQVEILEKLGFTVSGSAPALKVQPPSWRGDVEGRADLVEEVIRVHGLDKLPSVSVPKLTALTRSAETPSVTRARRTRVALAGRGMDETVTWSFIDRALADHFTTADDATKAALTIANPISSEMNFMRPSILPTLLQAAGRNSDRGYPDNALFEVGPVFETHKIKGQRQCAAGLRIGSAAPRHWLDKNAGRPVDAFDAKADAMAVLAACGLSAGSGQVTRDAPSYYHPGRSGVIRIGQVVLARFGELHPALLDALKICGPVAAFEVMLDAIPAAKGRGGTAKPLLTLSDFQPLSRDFAFIVDAATDADLILRTAKGVDKTLIADASVFDVYQGKGVDPDKKSVAIAVTLQPRDKTLTDAEIEQISKKIVDAVTAKTGAVLRG